MVNVLSLLVGLTAVVTGLSVSTVVSVLVRMAGWRVPAHPGHGFQPFDILDWITAVFTGPHFLLQASWEACSEGEMTRSLFALVAVVAAGWAGLLGLVILQLAFQLGLRMA
jgi:uncharacterized protein DUF6949